MSKILVTGAEGFIGSHLVERLLKDGHDAHSTVLYNFQGLPGWLEEVEPHPKHMGDIRDVEWCFNIMKDFEYVIHLAAMIDVWHSFHQPRLYVETNTVGTLNVAQACVRNNVKLIHTSSSEVFGTAEYTPQDERHRKNPQSPYAASKVAADSLVKSFVDSYSLRAVTLRPFNTYGPRQSTRAVLAKMCRLAALGATVWSLGNLQAMRDWVFVEDTVDAFVRALELPFDGQEYNFGTGCPISVSEALDIIAEYAGFLPMIEESPVQLRPTDAEVHLLSADASKFRGATDWKARTPITDGLKKTLEWWGDRV